MSLYTSGSVAEARAVHREQQAAKAAAHQPQPPEPITRPEAGALLLGLDRDRVLGAADEDLHPYIDKVLVESGWLHQQRQNARSGQLGDRPADARQHLSAVLERARTLQANTARADKAKRQRDAKHLCPVTQQVDPSTRPRRLPWSTPGAWGSESHSVIVSDRGALVLMAAALATATPDELDRARALLDQAAPPAAATDTSRRKRRR